MQKSEALKFAERKSAQNMVTETNSFFGVSTAEEFGKVGSVLLGASRNILPKNVGKIIPAAQMVLNGDLSKFLKGDTGGINAAIGALKSVLPPELAQLVGKAAPFLTKGLESFLKKGGLPDIGNLLNTDNLIGLAGQFLPPWAGDALSVGNNLFKGDINAALDSVLSKYLPPELKAVYDAIKKLPGGWKKFLDDLFNNPKEPQGANGLWAARLSDIVVCPGGVGAIISPCLPTLLIGGMPAARRSDIAFCNGFPTDKITIGEPTVWMGGTQLFAARISDETAHNGKITTGWETVHIGRKRYQADMCAAGKCVADAADSGAATIVGSGITAPLTDGGFGNLDGLGLGEALSSRLGDFAKDKLGGLVSDKVGGMISENEKPKNEISPQPNIFDDDE